MSKSMKKNSKKKQRSNKNKHVKKQRKKTNKSSDIGKTKKRTNKNKVASKKSGPKKDITSSRTKKSKKTKKTKKTKNIYKSIIFDLCLSVILTLVITNTIFFLLFSIKSIPNESMSPTFKKGDYALVRKNTSQLKRFEIVMVNIKGDYKIGRVIGLPNESIKYIDDYLFVNDLVVDEKFIVNQINEAHLKDKEFTFLEKENAQFKITKIPKNKYLILGDNRPNATDSRFYGLVERDDIYGKIRYRVFPLNKIEEF